MDYYFFFNLARIMLTLIWFRHCALTQSIEDVIGTAVDKVDNQ